MENDEPDIQARQLPLAGMPEPPHPFTWRSRATRFEARLSASVRLVQEPPYQSFFVDHRLFIRSHLDRPEEQRLAAVLLVESGAITQVQMADALGVSDRAIRIWREAYAQRGAAGLRRGEITKAPQPGAPEHPEAGSNSAPAQVGPPGRETDVSRYAGLALLAPFVRPLLEPLVQYVEDQGDAFSDDTCVWGASRLLPLITLYTAWGITNAEQSKRLYRREFGPLLDLPAAPSCRTLRRRLPLLSRAGLPEAAPRRLARALLQLGWIRLGEMYVDGHFVPYHGQEGLAKGWWPQRGRAQKGYTQHWVNDRQGKPLFCLFHQAFAAFPHVIPELAREIQSLLQEAGVEDEQPLVMVFDRGGYSAALFRELDRLGVGWITYKKYAPTVSAADLTEMVGLTGDREDVSIVHYGLLRVSVADYRDDVYAVAFDGRDAEQPAVLITNLDRIFPERCQPAYLIHALRDRWSQENFFKKGKVREGIDHLMGHEIRPMEATDCLVPNPKVLALRKRQQQLTRYAQIADRRYQGLSERYERLRKKPSWGRFLEQKQSRKIIQRHEALQVELAHGKQRLAELPEQVSYQTLHPEARDIIAFERNKVVMTLKCVAFHGYEALLRLAERYFLDHRERAQFVRMLIEAGGRYVRGQRSDTVHLNRPEIPRYALAAEALIGHLNGMKPRSLGTPSKPLRFRLR